MIGLWSDDTFPTPGFYFPCTTPPPCPTVSFFLPLQHQISKDFQCSTNNSIMDWNNVHYILLISDVYKKWIPVNASSGTISTVFFIYSCKSSLQKLLSNTNRKAFQTITRNIVQSVQQFFRWPEFMVEVRYWFPMKHQWALNVLFSTGL